MQARVLCSLMLGATAVAFVPSSASAKEPVPVTADDHDSEGYSYVFKDDPLSAMVGAETFARVTVLNHADRSTLIRPRTAFVVQLLKSVESL
jgi:hypothetical protein